MKYILLIAVVAGSFLLSSCSGGPQPEAGENKDTPVLVTVARPSTTNAGGVIASGQVEAAQSAAISTRVMGTITRIFVKLGDKVNKGQLLAMISSDDLAARRAQIVAQITGAQADRDNAQKDYDRYTALFSRQSATASELDNATLRLHAAKARLEGADQMRREVEASMAYTRLTAPFSGVVTQKLADEGSLAGPGMPLLTVEQDNVLQVSATVAESDISWIRMGDKAELEIKSTEVRASGSIAQISTSSAATGGQYAVKISLPAAAQKNLKAGMYVNVFIPIEDSNAAGAAGNGAILVPVSALVQNDQLTGLYTISTTHTALLRWVRTGKRVGDKIEILSGLDANETVIAGSTGKLSNGAPVKEQ